MRRARRQKRSMVRIKWLIGLLVLVLVTICYLRLGDRKNEQIAPGLIALDNVSQIMVLGVDRRADDAGRSDTLMIISVDTENSRAALLSVPRDTRVNIEGHGYDKINHAYAYGGHELTQRTIENLLGVPIDHYIIVDTKSFERIIDDIGGVDIDVEKRMYYEDPWDDEGGLVIDLYPGMQHLYGWQAIQYVRYRDGEGDIGRITRQQHFLHALLEAVISPNILPHLPDIAQEVSSAIETDMTFAELLSLANILKSVNDNGLSSDMVPGRPAYLKDISYWVPDILAARELLVAGIGAEMTDDMEDAAIKATTHYEENMPKDIKVVARTKPGQTIANISTESNEAETNTETPAKPPAKPMKPNEISVMVINSSGIDGAGAEVASIMGRKGFIISGVETGLTDARQNTTITTSSRNVDVFYGMPFECLIVDGGDQNQAVVNIGRDYKKQSN